MNRQANRWSETAHVGAALDLRTQIASFVGQKMNFEEATKETVGTIEQRGRTSRGPRTVRL